VECQLGLEPAIDRAKRGHLRNRPWTGLITPDDRVFGVRLPPLIFHSVLVWEKLLKRSAPTFVAPQDLQQYFDNRKVLL
jgi:hypothetical protein